MIMDDGTYMLEVFMQLPGMFFYTATERCRGATKGKKAQFPKKIFGLAGNMQLWSRKPNLHHYWNGKQGNTP